MLAKTEQWRLDLLNAADVIRQYGLTKNKLWERECGEISPTGAVCIRGAIIVAVLGERDMNKLLGDEYSRYDIADSKMHDYLKLPPPYWNNAEERTAEDVITALEHVALTSV